MRSISMAYPTIDLATTGAHIRQLRLEQGYSVQDLQTFVLYHRFNVCARPLWYAELT